MGDADGWPERLGVPESPERDGWHWVKAGTLEPECMLWCAQTQEWERRGGWWSADFAGEYWGYAGPCLLPNEVAAREDAARRAGIDAAAVVCDQWPFRHPDAAEGRVDSDEVEDAASIAAAIRALLEVAC